MTDPQQQQEQKAAQQQRQQQQLSEEELVSISKRLLLAIRKSDGTSTPISASSSNKKETALWEDIREQQTRLQEECDLESLVSLSEDAKKAFWINLYNSFLQLQLRNLQKENREAVADGATPSFIYKAEAIPIAGYVFSLDDIEHGILRRYRWKFLYGYIPNHYTLLTCSPIRKLACEKLDNRLHFALNCGAKSCPPIAYYTTEKIDTQLDQAAATYLKQETEVSPMTMQIHISKIFYWYSGDFGGTKGIYDLLEKYCWDHLKRGRTSSNGSRSGVALSEEGNQPPVMVGDIREYKLTYKEFSWDQKLDNFVFEADDGTNASMSTL